MPLVIDASVLTDVLLGREAGLRAQTTLVRYDGDLHIPHLAVVETASVLRSLVRMGEATADRANGALGELAVFPATRWPVEPLLARLWELRENATAYDGVYLALAEVLRGHLITSDVRLARAAEDYAACGVIVP